MELRVPGDKSISQRSLILGALAEGENRIRGLLPGGDPASTAGALRALGVPIPRLPEEGGEILFRGVGLRGLRTPEGALDLENSGTGARLLLGVLAGQPLEAVVTGDDSLRRRPMARVTVPLSFMGARFRFLQEEGFLPARVRGGPLRALDHDLLVASAQVKSALLLAGITGGAPVRVREPGRSRDHTERMLAALGVCLEVGSLGTGRELFLREPPDLLPPLELSVPGDFSSAAFFLVLGSLSPPGTELVIRGVGLNETRTGLLPVLERMGARLREENREEGEGGEPLGDLIVEASPLKGALVGGDEIPGLIDEIPILAAAAARAEGFTRITGARELRVKETDRIRALAENLRALGVEAEELEDGLEIQGTDRPLRGRVASFGDHRIAMAFGVLGALEGNEIRMERDEVVGVSFPGFWAALARVAPGGRRESASHRPPVVTLDGPAGSGKSTTAREVARRLGFLHLDSGALYRALTFALMDAGIPEEEWPNLTHEELDRFPIRLRPRGDGCQVLLGDRVLEGELRTPEVTSRVSPLSALPEVRGWLLDAQREVGRRGGVVADGRDMGTVVFPGAEVKIFLTAHLEERARRRFLEREGREPGPEEVGAEALRIEARDLRDAGREAAPLRQPADALVVDTSHLTFSGQVERILRHIRDLTGR